MRHILAARGVDMLAELACSRVLLAFDFDGTLAPIVSQRDRAEMRPRARRLLARVCELYPCAVISGRSRSDVSRRLAGARVRYVVGNHGLEPGRDLAAFAREVSAAKLELERALALVRGVEIEDKRYSLAIHYRSARRKTAARDAIHAAIERASVPLRLVGGKQVVNAIPRGAPHKGDALGELRVKARADAALFVGDDLTDEDVFALERPWRLIGIRVGQSARSAAGYYLRDQREIDGLLATLASLRAR